MFNFLENVKFLEYIVDDETGLLYNLTNKIGQKQILASTNKSKCKYFNQQLIFYNSFPQIQKKLQSKAACLVKISRHYMTIHKEEREVKNILSAITNIKEKNYF